jgi:hypothetical protein
MLFQIVLIIGPDGPALSHLDNKAATASRCLPHMSYQQRSYVCHRFEFTPTQSSGEDRVKTKCRPYIETLSRPSRLVLPPVLCQCSPAVRQGADSQS